MSRFSSIASLFFFFFSVVFALHPPVLMPDRPSRSNGSISFDPSLNRHVHWFPSSSIRRLHVQGGPFEVQLYQNLHAEGNSSSVDVQTLDHLHPLVSVGVANTDQLLIRTPEHLRWSNESSRSIVLSINFAQLKEIYLDGRVSLRCLNPIRSETFRLFAHGHTDIRLKVRLATFDAYLHSLGRIKLCGRVDGETTIQSLGLADVHAENLLTSQLNVVSSGIGNVFVTSTGELNISSTGIGHVYYRGQLHQQVRTGLGNLIQLEDLHRLTEE